MISTGTRRVFNDQQERSLKAYILKCAQMNVGLTPETTRRLAYEMAQRNNIPVPQSWIDHEMAGADWMAGFLKRNSDISLRKPEGCSLARSVLLMKKI